MTVALLQMVAIATVAIVHLLLYAINSSAQPTPLPVAPGDVDAELVSCADASALHQ